MKQEETGAYFFFLFCDKKSIERISSILGLSSFSFRSSWSLSFMFLPENFSCMFCDSSLCLPVHTLVFLRIDISLKEVKKEKEKKWMY